jgi:hypothetical protein
MMLAHATGDSMDWIFTANLLFLWSVGECVAIVIGLHGVSLVFKKRHMPCAFLYGAFSHESHRIFKKVLEQFV